MTCRTSSDCASRPDRNLLARTPALGGKKKVAPLAATVLLHAAAIAALAIPSSGTKPADASAKPFTVALLAGQGETDAPAKPEAFSPQTASRFAPASRPAASQPAAGTASAGPIPAIAVDANTAGGPGASGASETASAGTAAGQARTGASIPAHYASGNKKPEYPLLARRLEEQGTVVLRVLVREDGRAGKVVVRQSSGHELLDESARSAVEKWRFQPASIGNVAVAEWYQVAIPFTLYN